MFMKTMNREPITIYNKVGNTYQKTVLDGIWKQSTQASFKSQGVLPLDTVKIYIDDFADYVSYAYYKDLDDKNGLWTISIGNEQDDTYIVRGKCDFNFPVGDDERALHSAIRSFEKDYIYKRANLVKENINGAITLKHVVIIC